MTRTPWWHKKTSSPYLGAASLASIQRQSESWHHTTISEMGDRTAFFYGWSCPPFPVTTPANYIFLIGTLVGDFTLTGRSVPILICLADGPWDPLSSHLWHRPSSARPYQSLPRVTVEDPTRDPTRLLPTQSSMGRLPRYHTTRWTHCARYIRDGPDRGGYLATGSVWR